MTVTVGRIVQYRDRPYNPDTGWWGVVSDPQPAIVTKVWSDTCVNLQVFFDNGPIEVRTSVMFDEGDVPSSSQTWRWPPRA